MEATPTFRGFVRALWPLVTNQARREVKKMGQVRPELMRVVYSQLTDEEAAERLREVVRSDPSGARATLAYVTRIRDASWGYETDRAYRVLHAAMSNEPPESVSPGNAELFKRERDLGWTPLQQAFAQLADAVPELAEVARTVEAEPTNDWMRRVEKLIGPRSLQTDPLLHSALAATVVARYLGVISKGSDAGRLGRPVWSSGVADPQPQQPL